uniref:NOL1/NOP2/Sun domain family, member 7 n=1 Tax=Cricetulus griseus TaxID=10029 RepID=A0A8C2LYX4_CRIGR
MLDPKSELEFFNEENMEEISQLASLEMSGDAAARRKSAAVVPGKSGYPDCVYVMAANIFQGIRIEKPPDKAIIKYGNEPLPSCYQSEDESFQRLSYELAFSALKYQDILETMLIDSYIFPSTTIVSKQLYNYLIIVMLYDFQDRKFQSRVLSDNEESISEVQEVESLLNSFKTKLAAALARCRIKHDALSIYHILPETVRKQEQRASTLPLYAWINTGKISLEEVYSNLKKKGYNKVKSVLHLEDKAFAVDQHCYDVVIFPAHLKKDLVNIDLFKDYKLIFQDKSRSLAVHSVKALLNMDDDILMVNMGSWYTVAHMSILTNNNTSKIFVCGIQSQDKDPEMKKLFTKMGCQNIEILQETFVSLESKDHRLQNVKVILLLPRCSALGVSNPVEFILNENEVAKAQAIVYCTCSVYAEENENVVMKALESQTQGIKIQPYRLSPPVLPLCSLKDIRLSMDKFFRVEPSDVTNGCFISILTRERDPSETVSVKDVLARAAAKGLLDGVEVGKTGKREKKRKKSKTLLPKAPVNETNDIQVKINEFLNRESKASTNRAKTSLPSKTVSQMGASSHVRKTNNPLATTLTKNTRPEERHITLRRTRPEGKTIPLKSVEIVLPPVIFPFSSAQGARSQTPTNHLYYRLGGSKAGYLTSALKKGEKPKETTTSLLRHPRPWL